MTHSTAVSADNMEMLAQGLSQLQSLDLGHCPLMQDDLALELLPLRPTLTRLDLSGSHRLTDRGIVDITKLSNLSHLVLQGCSRITNQCMGPIARLAKLRLLGIGECKKVALPTRLPFSCITDCSSRGPLPEIRFPSVSSSRSASVDRTRKTLVLK
eukprot:1186843-Prorocentrum_minimum.AAC.2